jgi:hypothetical protein
MAYQPKEKRKSITNDAQKAGAAMEKSQKKSKESADSYSSMKGPSEMTSTGDADTQRADSPTEQTATAETSSDASDAQDNPSQQGSYYEQAGPKPNKWADGKGKTGRGKGFTKDKKGKKRDWTTSFDA